MSGARKALQAAIDAYHRKAMDMSSPTPTEEYEAGGGAIGYAEQAIDAAGLAILPKVAEGVEEALYDFEHAAADSTASEYVGAVNRARGRMLAAIAASEARAVERERADVRITPPEEDPYGEGREYLFVQTPAQGEMFDIRELPPKLIAAIRARTGGAR